MSIYSYPKSIIDEVVFKKTANGAIRAYLHAQNGIDAEKVQSVQQALKDAGLEWVPYTLNDKPMLEVRGFKNEKQLLKLLGKKEWLQGEPKKTLEKEDNVSLWEKFKKRTLQATGATYLIGDIGFFSYGRREADKLVMAGAFSYFLGTLSLLFYGRNDQSDLQVKLLAKDLEHFVADQKIHLPENSALHEITKEKKQNLLQSLNDFGRRYPSEIFNTVTALAGVFVATSAFKNKIKFKPKLGTDAKAIREMHQEGWLDFGLGSLTTVSGMLATLVKEKKPDPDDPPAKGGAWIWEKIREHPLAIAGGGYTISTLCHAASTWKAYKEAKRVNDKIRLASVPNRALFVGMALLSEFLLAISSKGHGEGVVSDESVDGSAIAIAADLIVRQPRGEQDKLIDYMGKFLGQQDVLALGDQEAIDKLRHQVEAMRHNPWAQQPEAAPSPAPLPEPSAWQAKLAAENVHSLSPQLAT